MLDLFVNNQPLCQMAGIVNAVAIKELIQSKIGLEESDYYILSNGKHINDEQLQNCSVYIILRLNGGKGGFGSMLRAIGAQIEKTTNREACRDLSGRRLRDINEEKRLKNWISAQAEREQEAEDRKQKKLERLCRLPKHEFKDESYDKERSALPEKVEDAVTQGFKASVSGKRAHVKDDVVKKKKKKLWIDEELEGLSSSDEESDEGAAKSLSNSDDSKPEDIEANAASLELEEPAIASTSNYTSEPTKASEINIC